MPIKTAKEIEHEWIRRSGALAVRTRKALRRVMLDLARESRAHSAHAWHQRKAPMALYHRAVATHAERLERAVRRQAGERAESKQSGEQDSYSTRAAAAARKRRWKEMLTDIEHVERETTREILRALHASAGQGADAAWERGRVHEAVHLRVLSVYAGHVMRAMPRDLG